MAMISSLWDTLVGDKKRDSNKASKLDSVNHSLSHLEKRKLVATRARLESQASNKLDLNHLRARIDSESRDYAAMRERQQNSRSRWFGERSAFIDEAALTKRLAAPTPKLSQEELDLSLNYGDIHLPDYYDSSLVPSFAGDCPEEVEAREYAEVFKAIEAIEEPFICTVDTADFSDLAKDLAEVSLMPPLAALSDNIPELNELLARLQIVEAVVAQEKLQESEERASREHHADLHIVTPFEVCLPSPANSPVPLIKSHGKGKKGKRARSKEAAKIKSGTRN
ncbi:MAG: hypothetical protein C0508_29180 [Cyanobacteria bacterium PR.023]|nr:hypothetical protein [Cyanobacteria bacterium PR.023]